MFFLQTSRHKTTVMVKRHILKLRRHNISTATEICLAESLQELVSIRPYKDMHQL